MDTPAPNFSGSYPLAGERIGPAWRDVWARLSRRAWLDGTSLAEEVAPLHDVASETVVNLMRQARAVGVLEMELRRNPGRKRASGHYRVK